MKSNNSKRALKSPFEFVRFLKENPDPFHIKEKGLQQYTIEEIAKHSSPPSIWTIYNNKVYDITMYLEYHPGGKEILEGVGGKDCTELFSK